MLMQCENDGYGRIKCEKHASPTLKSSLEGVHQNTNDVAA